MKWIRFFFYISLGFFLLILLLSFFSSYILGYYDVSFFRSIKRKNAGQVFSVYHHPRCELSYVRAGEENSQPLILLHGSPGNWSNFSFLYKEYSLHQKYDLISIDRPGFGRSCDALADMSLQSQAYLLNDFVDHFQFKNKPILLGYSLGGPLAVQMVALNPDLFSALILVAGSFDPELEPRQWYRPLFHMFPFNLFLVKDIKSSNTELWRHKKDLLMLKYYWPMIQCPVVIVQGLDDMLVPAENALFAQKNLISAPEIHMLFIPDENHFIPFTDNGKEAMLRAFSITDSVLNN
jgi:pimeloyl-ACP methyl ester carboxylesterase